MKTFSHYVLPVSNTFFLWSYWGILRLILKIIGQCDVIHIMTSLKKTIKSVVKISTYIITSITARNIGLPAILVIISVSTFITAVTLYIYISFTLRISVSIFYYKLSKYTWLYLPQWSFFFEKWGMLYNFLCLYSSFVRQLTFETF